MPMWARWGLVLGVAVLPFGTIIWLIVRAQARNRPTDGAESGYPSNSYPSDM
ncbi:MAG: hypothetical protein QM775_26090 [Pirellulales bacterium]